MSMRHLWLLVILTGSLCSISVPLDAQIVPDSMLGDQRSRLTPNAIPGVDLIDGGAQRGSSLFHSFDQFNINPGQRVYFANPSSIQNILTRITGNTTSNIQGVLGVAGNANLFLLNPNGILFGPNAQLDIRGSFVGTTVHLYLTMDNSLLVLLDKGILEILILMLLDQLHYKDNFLSLAVCNPMRSVTEETSILPLIRFLLEMELLCFPVLLVREMLAMLQFRFQMGLSH